MPIISTQDQEESIGQSEILSTAGDHASGPVERRVIFWSWLTVTIVGFLQAMAGRFVVNPDGVAYADLADAYIRGDWHNAINAHWSPLYPFLLSIAFRLFHPSPYFESTVIHVVNFFLYLLCFACLQFLIFEIAASRASEYHPSTDVRFSRPALLVLGTVTFLIAMQYYLRLSFTTPDLGVVAVAFLANTATLRIERLGPSYKRLFGFGVILAFGYLAKAAFFPIAFLYVATAALGKTGWRKTLLHATIILSAFFIVAGPNIIAVSKIKHSFTVSDTPSLNYIWWIDGVSYTHLQAGSFNGAPIHPTRKIFQNPNVYEFGSPIEGTHPVWFDPSYWHEGVRPHFDLQRQLLAMQRTWNRYEVMFSQGAFAFFVWLFLLILQYQCGFLSRQSFMEYWRIVVPSLAVLGLYFLIYVEGRYVAGFIIVLWIAIYSSIRLPDTEVSKHALIAALIVLVVATTINLYPDLSANVQTLSVPAINVSWEVASTLHKEFGLREGDAVGCIGDCLESYWARVGKLRIITEIQRPQDFAFMRSSPATQLGALHAMSATGAQVVVTTLNLGNGWKRIGETDYFAYDLRH